LEITIWLLLHLNVKIKKIKKVQISILYKFSIFWINILLIFKPSVE